MFIYEGSRDVYFNNNQHTIHLESGAGPHKNDEPDDEPNWVNYVDEEISSLHTFDEWTQLSLVNR